MYPVYEVTSLWSIAKYSLQGFIKCCSQGANLSNNPKKVYKILYLGMNTTVGINLHCEEKSLE